MLAALVKYVLRPDPFAAEIAAFRASESAAPSSSGAILFAGSSSIRMWVNLAVDMAPFRTINRGFGGSSIVDIVHHFRRIAAIPAPRAIVFYAGDNDLESRRTPAQIVAGFEHFMRLKSRRFGTIPVFFVSIKPAPARAKHRAAREAVNSLIRQRALGRADLVYVDIAHPMLAAGRLDDLFLPDGIHLSAAGYAVWRAAILDALFAVFPEARPIV